MDAVRQTRSVPSLPGGYRDFPGDIHVHTELSKDSRGKLEEIVEAVRASGGAFVITTDHHQPSVYERGFDGWKEGILIVRGSEIIKGCRGITGAGCNSLLVIGLDDYLDPKGLTMEEVIGRVRSSGGLAIAAHPDGFVDWQAPVDGMEIYDILDDAAENKWLFPKWAFDVLYSYRLFRDEVFLSILDPPARGLRRWDRLTETRRVVAVAGNDAHQNLRWAGRQIDPYGLTLRFVRTHVLAPALADKADLLRSIASGHAYVSFDGLADAGGFAVWAEDGEPDGTGIPAGIMGDEMPLRPGLRIRVQAPLEGRIRVIRNGVKMEETVSRGTVIPVSEPGVYRVEVSLKIRGCWRPWIYSNPIYVREASS
jgi:predicted metal-dependent phosphoesterase TrpH